jgi:hypothetical protein
MPILTDEEADALDAFSAEHLKVKMLRLSQNFSFWEWLCFQRRKLRRN